ncbi:MAG: hypothetical protein WAN92_04655 [Herbaspirillum sp.]
MKFEGIYTPAIVLLDQQGQIDKAAYVEVLEHLIAVRVHGIFCRPSISRCMKPARWKKFR